MFTIIDNLNKELVNGKAVDFNVLGYEVVQNTPLSQTIACFSSKVNMLNWYMVI
jgi:hypothetical protein